MNIQEWWMHLDWTKQLFYAVALIGSTGVVILLISQMIGFSGHDLHIGDPDASVSADHAAGVSYLSVRSLIAALAGFGWAGVVSLEAGAGFIASILIALAVGLLCMLSIVWLMRWMMRLDSSGSLDYRNAIGLTGMTYIPIAAAQAPGGQIEIQVQGRLCVVAAISKGAAIPSRTPVTVTGLADPTTLVVEPVVR